MSWLQADFSSVEARITCWVSGQQDALDEYRQGVDRYKRMASFVYGVAEKDVNKHPQRFVGKQCILGCGYGMGPAKFRVTCKKMGNYDLPVGVEDRAVKAFRAKHKKVVSFWYDMESAAKCAIIRKNTLVTVGKVVFCHKDIEGIPFLFMKLPSGRRLAYPRPRISGDRITFFGNTIGTNWGDVSTWGGTLVENLVQGIAADLMAHGSHQCEQHGYEIATLIHDECICFNKPGQTVEELVRLLTDLPPWASGLPIEAEGALIPFYKK